jgi:2-methylcitrate dehydratase PrpD
MEMTRTLADFVTEVRFEDLPSEVVTTSKRAFLDTLGVILAGSREPCAGIVVDYCRTLEGSREATVFGTGLQTTAPLAALANGTAGHALDYDDVNETMHGHPSIPPLPVILALGEKLGCSGREAITAFVLGVEVECKLGKVMGDGHYQAGWHATATLGTMAATIDAAKLLRLNHDAVRHALGIATSMASGSRQNFGTMTKPLHAGLAARNGLEAVLLAARGFTADANILESRMGFFRLFSPAGESLSLDLEGFGNPWDLLTPGLSVKKYPCCFATHHALDATLDLVQEYDVTPGDVQKVAVKVRPGSSAILIHPRPQTGLEGKFSMQYCLAAAILDRKVSLASFADHAVQRPEAQQFLPHVVMEEEPGPPQGPREAFAEVTFALQDGRSLCRRVDIPRGHAKAPLSWEELAEKFLDCASYALSEAQARRGLEQIQSLEKTPLKDLAQTLAGS